MISRTLARFIVASRPEDIPAAARCEAIRSVFNVIGTALGGSGDDGVGRIRAATLPFSGPSDAVLIGTRARADCLTAAFLNALAANVFDFDDTHPGTIIHPSAPVAPTLFALAGRRKMTGAELLHAFVLGAEIECRLGNAVSPGHYIRGWHITATCGVFGAAAACGKVLGLDEDAMLWALGHACAQSSGLVETLGTMAKSVGVGQSARGGLLAAFLAEGGVVGPERPIEGERGFLKVMGVPADAALVLAGLGDSWEIEKNTYKPYPCGVVLNPVIDACLALREEHTFDLREVASVIVRGNPLLRQRADRPDPESGRQAQVSAQHAAAIALVDGRAGIAEFSDAAVARLDTRAVRAKVSVVETPAFHTDSAEVEIALSSGRSLSQRIDHARGSSARPLRDADLEAKFRSLAAIGCPALDPDPLIGALWSLAEAPNAAAVIELAAPFSD